MSHHKTIYVSISPVSIIYTISDSVFYCNSFPYPSAEINKFTIPTVCNLYYLMYENMDLRQNIYHFLFVYFQHKHEP